MKGVLVIAHGSRQTSTEQTLQSVVEMARAKLPGVQIETAFMEFNKPDIPAALEALVQSGVDEIAAVPYFLFDGIHIHEDIPEALEQFRQEHPGVRLTMGGTLGADSRLADILVDRIDEAL